MAPEVELVSLRADLFGSRRFVGQLQAQLSDHPSCDVILDCEDVVDGALVDLGPELDVLIGVNEPHIDAHSIAESPHGSRDYVRYVHLARRGANIDVVLAKRISRRGRNHKQLRDARQQVGEFDR